MSDEHENLAEAQEDSEDRNSLCLWRCDGEATVPVERALDDLLLFDDTACLGAHLPKWEIEYSECENGCCLKSWLHDTANDVKYLVGMGHGVLKIFKEDAAKEHLTPPPHAQAWMKRKREASLN